MKKLILLGLLLLLGTSSGLAQQKKMYEPKKSSSERVALLDAIRAYDVVRNDDLQGEIFEVNALKVQGNWAFATVERSNLSEAGTGTHLAFLRKSGSAWKVMWSDNNDREEVGVAALSKLRKKYKDFYKELVDFAESRLAG